jgi:hypothetical protein
MTFRERRDRTAAAKIEVQAARKRLNAALRSMYYKRALTCQIEVDRLDRLARWLDHGHGHELYPSWDEIGQA